MEDKNIITKCQESAYNSGRSAQSITAYAGVISNTIGIFSHAIGDIIDNLRTQVARQGAEIAMKMVSGFEQIREDATSQFQNVLISSTAYTPKHDKYEKALSELKKRFPDIDEEKIKTPPRNTEQDIVVLIAIFLGGLLLEGVIGSFLLGEVLAGGFIAGLGFAIAISLINVGGLGLGLGVVYDNFHRKKKIPIWWFMGWFALVLVINSGVALYRYEQVVQFNEEGIDPVLAMFLFALLGILFASVAFWRAYKNWEPEALLHEQWKELDDEEQGYHADIKRILVDYTRKADSRYNDIEGFYQGLKQLVFAAEAQWQILKVNYERVRPVVEMEFLAGLGATKVKEYSSDDLSDFPFPSWKEVSGGFKSIEEARNILDKWESGERTSFVRDYNRIINGLAEDAQKADQQINRNINRHKQANKA